MRISCFFWTNPPIIWIWTAGRCWKAALYDFPGTILFVSHDRYFINSIATRILDMTENGITLI